MELTLTFLYWDAQALQIPIMVPVMTPATVSPSPALLTWSPLVEGTHLCNALYSLEGGQLAHDRMNPYNSLHMFLKEGVEGPTANP